MMHFYVRATIILSVSGAISSHKSIDPSPTFGQTLSLREAYDVANEQPPYVSYTYHSGDELLSNASHVLDHLIQWACMHLKSYVSANDFDYTRFDQQPQKVSEVLFNAWRLAEKVPTLEKATIDQFALVVRLYQFMVGSTESIKIHKRAKSASQDIIIPTIILNVRAFMAQNMCGIGRITSAELFGDISVLTSELKMLESEFQGLSGASLGTCNCFGVYAAQVRGTLDGLRRRVSLNYGT
ncbi:hypothetical protein OXX59_006406 [Metschnikowia pulcherrima]